MNNEISRYVVFMSMLQLASYKRMLQPPEDNNSKAKNIFVKFNFLVLV